MLVVIIIKKGDYVVVAVAPAFVCTIVVSLLQHSTDECKAAGDKSAKAPQEDRSQKSL